MPSSSSKLPPGPPGRFLFGNVLELSGNSIDFLVDCARKYGDAVFFKFFNVPICLLVHPDYIEHALVTNQSNFVKSRDYRVLSHVMGEGLLTAEGKTWQQQRKLVQPAFHHENLVKYGKVMLDCATRMLDSWGVCVTTGAKERATRKGSPLNLNSVRIGFRFSAF